VYCNGSQGQGRLKLEQQKPSDRGCSKSFGPVPCIGSVHRA
jgi:hypothetical protein